MNYNHRKKSRPQNPFYSKTYNFAWSAKKTKNTLRPVNVVQIVVQIKKASKVKTSETLY